MPVSHKSLITFLSSTDYQAASLDSYQIGKEYEYMYAKLSGPENYKEWARKMIFALKNLELWGYVDRTIMKSAPLLAKEKTIAKVKQETQNKIKLWTKDDAHTLRKIGQMYNKTV